MEDSLRNAILKAYVTQALGSLQQAFKRNAVYCFACWITWAAAETVFFPPEGTWRMLRTSSSPGGGLPNTEVSNARAVSRWLRPAQPANPRHTPRSCRFPLRFRMITTDHRHFTLHAIAFISHTNLITFPYEKNRDRISPTFSHSTRLQALFV